MVAAGGDRVPTFIQVLLLIVLVAVVYGSRPTLPNARGEEPRRAQTAREMLETGDWVVPRVQGVPFVIRPPFHNWAIALSMSVRGDRGLLTIRLPSLLAILLTTLLVFGYGRALVSPLAGFAAAAAFATMVQVLEIGRLAENESLFTLLVSASLLLWHLAYTRQWSAPAMWVTGYSLAALGALTKTAQAPFYFVTCVTVFLALRRDWRALGRPAHALGLLSFACIYGAWQVPFSRLGADAAATLYVVDIASRFVSSAAAAVTHLITFPFELFACTLPWSLFLLAFLSARVRGRLGELGLGARFVALCLVVTLPTVWLPPGGRTRYFMPLYPLIAVLIGVAVQRCYALQSDRGFAPHWRRSLRVVAAAMMVLALAVLGVSLWTTPDNLPWAQPRGFAVVYAGVVLAAAAVVVRLLNGGDVWRWHAAILGLALFSAVTVVGVFVNKQVHVSIDNGGQIARLEQRIPAGHTLVSLQPLPALFLYYYSVPIPLVDALERIPVGTFFCVVSVGDEKISLPFAWRRVDAVSMTRSRRRSRQTWVVVGRRVAADS